MKGLGVTLGLAVLLSALLLIVAVPTSAGKKKPGNDPPARGRDKQKPDKGQKGAGGKKSKKALGAQDPANTTPITSTGVITICHKPGTPAQKTLVLPASAGPGHLGHGDYLGVCEEQTPTVPTDTLPISPTGVITICHKPGTPAQKTLVLPAAALFGHMQHGDKYGPCPDAAAAAPVYRGGGRRMR